MPSKDRRKKLNRHRERENFKTRMGLKILKFKRSAHQSAYSAIGFAHREKAMVVPFPKRTFRKAS